jgi:hypothetical protein
MGIQAFLLRGSLPLLLSCSLVTGILVVVSSEGRTAVAAEAGTAPAEEFLFTVESASGTTRKLQHTAEVERFTLTLVGVAPVTRFADRPFRDASILSPRSLAANWQSWFEGDPPNAVLTFARPGRAPGSMVVALNRPRYSATERTLTFTAFREKRVDDPANRGASWERLSLPSDFNSASLFIDNCSSCGQIPMTQS